MVSIVLCTLLCSLKQTVRTLESDWIQTGGGSPCLLAPIKELVFRESSRNEL